MSDRPLLTFVLLAYNQEEYIREAVEGAFSQTYRPLEIILSDDCSSDRTFQIMQELAMAYKGPHIVVLNRNEKNLGIGGHVNKIVKMARGELIVVAAGDDISLPERVEKTYRVYEGSGGRGMSIYTSVRVIDRYGRQAGIRRRPLERGINDFQTRLKNVRVGVVGASHAWHRRVFEVFGDMLDETIAEDTVIPFRASLLGMVCFLDEPLVLYRRHATNLTGRGRLGTSRLDLFKDIAVRRTRTLITLKNYLRDLDIEHPDIHVDAGLRDRVKKQVARQITTVELDIAFLKGRFSDQIGVICQGVREGLPFLRICAWIFRLVFPSLYARKVRPTQEDYLLPTFSPDRASIRPGTPGRVGEQGESGAVR